MNYFEIDWGVGIDDSGEDDKIIEDGQDDLIVTAWSAPTTHLNFDATLCSLLTRLGNMQLTAWGVLPAQLTLDQVRSVIVNQSSILNVDKNINLHMIVFGTLANLTSITKGPNGHEYVLKALELIPYLSNTDANVDAALGLITIATYLTSNSMLLRQLMSSEPGDADLFEIPITLDTLWKEAKRHCLRGNSNVRNFTFLRILLWEMIMTSTSIDQAEEVGSLFDKILFSDELKLPAGSNPNDFSKSIIYFRVLSVCTFGFLTLMVLNDSVPNRVFNSLLRVPKSHPPSINVAQEKKHITRGNFLFFLLEKIRICENELKNNFPVTDRSSESAFMALRLACCSIKVGLLHRGNLEKRLEKGRKGDKRGKAQVTGYFSEHPEEFPGEDIYKIKSNLAAMYSSFRYYALQRGFDYIGGLVSASDKLVLDYYSETHQNEMWRSLLSMVKSPLSAVVSNLPLLPALNPDKNTSPAPTVQFDGKPRFEFAV
eukprot:TRINITY_DN5852_c0_g1_i2.p1 TRINITY_DN5852_c0_g1~~TRINITY_DN5852_c0_g1_i2.p1  ORF type:complete len:485 (+),score=68.20 TRINITY_DN5852_c0_g1_i2:21-1475(+)